MRALRVRDFNPAFLKIPPHPRYEEIRQLLSSYQNYELEIGAGVGLHPVLRAKESPETLMIGIERTKEKAEKFFRREQNHQLKNLVAVHADVIPWLWYFQEDILFDQVWILYPNPEPGNKNQRWIHSPFMGHLVKRIKSSSKIIIATNIISYADEIEKYSEKNWNLKAKRFQYLGAPRTHFEKKYLQRGEKCFEIQLTKG